MGKKNAIKVAGWVTLKTTTPFKTLEGRIEIRYDDDDRISHVVVDTPEPQSQGEMGRNVIFASDILGISYDPDSPDSLKSEVHFLTTAEIVVEDLVADIASEDGIEHFSDRIEFKDEKSRNRMVVMSNEFSVSKVTAGSVTLKTTTTTWNCLTGRIKIRYDDDDRISVVELDSRPQRGKISRTLILASNILGISYDPDSPDSLESKVYCLNLEPIVVMVGGVTDISAEGGIERLSDRIEFEDSESGNRMVVMSTEASASKVVEIYGKFEVDG